MANQAQALANAIRNIQVTGAQHILVNGQLIASRFYEAMQRELKQLPMHDPKRAALVAASGRCERIAAARIDPTVLLDELRKALAVLTEEHLSEPPPIKGRPVLRLIEGGLSN